MQRQLMKLTEFIILGNEKDLTDEGKKLEIRESNREALWEITASPPCSLTTFSYVA